MVTATLTRKCLLQILRLIFDVLSSNIRLNLTHSENGVEFNQRDLDRMQDLHWAQESSISIKIDRGNIGKLSLAYNSTPCPSGHWNLVDSVVG